MKRNRFVVVVLLVVVVGAAGCFLYMRNRSGKQAPASEAASMSRLTRITDSNTTAYVVQEYSGDYATISKEIQDPRMAQWSKTTLDNAYFCLLYADRTGAFTQVYSMLGMIEIAQKGGLNIDDNSFGIAQADRDAIKARADASSQRTHE